jgi:hypothetical protein
VQGDTVCCFTEIKRPTHGIEARVTGQRARVKIKAADSWRLKNFAGDDLQRMDVKEEVHLVRADLLGE